MTIQLRTIIIGAVLLAIGVFSAMQVSSYIDRQRQEDKERTVFIKLVVENNAGVKTLLSAEVQPSSMTYAELFQNADDRLKSLQNLAVEVETAPISATEKESTSSYVTLLQELVRTLRGKYQKQLSFSTAVDMATSAVKDLSNSTDNEYSYKYASQRYETAKSERDEAYKEATIASEAFAAEVKELQTKLPNINKKMAEIPTLDQDFVAKLNKAVKT